jgi:hypothetical protein
LPLSSFFHSSSIGFPDRQTEDDDDHEHDQESNHRKKTNRNARLLTYILNKECAACLDAAVAKGLVSADRVCLGKQMLARVEAMLSRLIDRFNR